MEQKCPQCGADNLEAARFRRKCGVPVAQSLFHEAPTRNFQQQPQAVPDHMSGPPPGPGYQNPPMYMPPVAGQQPTGFQMQPGVTGLPQRINTSPLATGSVGRKGPNWLLIVGGIILAVLLGFGILAAVIAHKVTTAIEGAKAGNPGAIPSVTFSSSDNSDPGKLPKELKSWYYEDATIETVVSGGFGPASGSVLTMESEDDVSDIADFYRDKFAKSKHRVENNENGKVVLTGDNTTVVIEPSGKEDGKNQIVVALGDFGGLPGGIPSGIPEPPAPPAPPVVTAPTAPAPGGTGAKPDAKAPRAEKHN